MITSLQCSFSGTLIKKNIVATALTIGVCLIEVVNNVVMIRDSAVWCLSWALCKGLVMGEYVTSDTLLAKILMWLKSAVPFQIRRSPCEKKESITKSTSVALCAEEKQVPTSPLPLTEDAVRIRQCRARSLLQRLRLESKKD